MTLRSAFAALALLGVSSAPALATVIVPPLPAAQVDAEHIAAAEEAHARAGAAWERGDLDAALREATTAYRALPNASTALTRAVIAGELGRHREAFEAYLVARDLQPTPEELAQIDAGLARHGAAARPALGWVVIVVDPPGARVTVDDVSFEAPRIIGASEGRHTVVVQAEGREPARGAFTVAPGVSQRLDYELPVARPIEVRVEEPASGPDRVAEWLLIGGGAALVVTGAAFHFMAFEAANETEQWAQPPSPTTEENAALWRGRHAAASDDLDRNQALAWALYGVGGALAVTGVVLWVVRDGEASTSGTVTPVAGWQAGAPSVGAHVRF